jgi:hypothetical protein
MSTALVKSEVQGVVTQVQEIQLLMKEAMKEGEHYGTIPGCGDKKVLLKSGAEKLCLLFHIAPEYKIEKTDLDRGHREYMITCRLVNRDTGIFLGEGVGLCSSMEKKYGYRQGTRKCPNCGEETIKRSKFDNEGWYCFAKIGGCGAKFNPDDTEITNQETGRIDNPDLPDTFNTVLKLAKKRALVDATLTATAASDIFTQDLEDEVAVEVEVEISKKPEEPKSEPVADKAKEAESEKLLPKILDLIEWYKDADFLNTLTIVKRRNYQKLLLDSEGKSVVDNDKINIHDLPRILNAASVRTWHEGIGELYDTYDLTKGTTDGKQG